MVSGENKIFEAVYSKRNPEVPFMKKGKIVKITFLQTKEEIISCETFDLLDINLTEENPNQARFNKDRKTSDVERDRIKTIDERDKILNSNEMKKIDPDSLKNFLRSQRTKK